MMVKFLFHLCVRVIKLRPETFTLFTLPVLKNHCQVHVQALNPSVPTSPKFNQVQCGENTRGGQTEHFFCLGSYLYLEQFEI